MFGWGSFLGVVATTLMGRWQKQTNEQGGASIRFLNCDQSHKITTKRFILIFLVTVIAIGHVLKKYPSRQTIFIMTFFSIIEPKKLNNINFRIENTARTEYCAHTTKQGGSFAVACVPKSCTSISRTSHEVSVQPTYTSNRQGMCH